MARRRARGIKKGTKKAPAKPVSLKGIKKAPAKPASFRGTKKVPAKPASFESTKKSPAKPASLKGIKKAPAKPTSFEGTKKVPVKPASFESTKKAPTKPASFKETRKNLDCLQDLLRCVVCQIIPDKVYKHISIKCDHKYCKTCVSKVEGRICLICDLKVEKMDMKLDVFSTGLASRVKKFEHALSAMNNELKSNDDVIVITID